MHNPRNPENSEQFDIKLQLAFPRSTEDRRLQLVKINDSIFAIVHFPLESDGPIQLYCDEWSLILLTPIKSKANIVISAINVICLNEIESKEGEVTIHAKNRLVKLAPLKPVEKIHEIVEGKEYQFEDLGAIMYYYRLFQGIVNDVHVNSPASMAQAQQKFLTGLCALAQKIEGAEDNLNLRKILDLWGVS
jgi:hypothetical protein